MKQRRKPIAKAPVESRQDKWDRLWGAYIDALQATCLYKDMNKLDQSRVFILYDSVLALKGAFPEETKGMFPE